MTFGTQLTPIEVGSINGHVEAGIELYKVLKGAIEQRIQIESEFSKKLEGLAKKTKSDLVKLNESQAFGDLDLEFAKASDFSEIDLGGPLLDSVAGGGIPSLGLALSAWTKQIWDEAQGRRLLIDDLKSNIVDKLSVNHKFLDTLREENMKCHRDLLSKRDAVYEQKDSTRAEYNAIKDEFSKSRDKQLRAENEKKQDRYQKKAQNQASQRDRMKNYYILAVNTANAVKNCTNEVSFPAIMDNMYNINMTQISNIRSLLMSATKKQNDFSQHISKRFDEVFERLGSANAEGDIQTWIQKRIDEGISKQEDDPDFRVVLDQSRGDHDGLITEGCEERILTNMVVESRIKLEPIREEIEDLEAYISRGRAELERVGFDDGEDEGVQRSDAVQDLDKALRSLAAAKLEEAKWLSRQTFIENILGEIRVDNPHDLKKESFVLGSTCAVCEKTVRGDGLKCTVCEVKLHTSCKLDNDPECSGAVEKPRGFLARTFKGRKKTHKREPSSELSVSSGMASKVSLNDNSPHSASPSYANRSSTEVGAPPPVMPRKSLSSSTFGAPALPVRSNTQRSTASHITGHPVVPVPSRASKPRSRSPSFGPSVGNGGGIIATTAGFGLPPRIDESSGKWMEVISDYQGEGEDYLSVRIGDRVFIPDDGESWPGWVLAEMNGKRGLVPEDYISSPQSTSGPGITSRPLPSQPIPRATGSPARVLYDYTGDPGSDVLTIKQNQEILVTDQNVGSGWVEAKVGSSTGLVPESYIQYL
ncbi:Protein BZZ1 [Mycoemilia scoparia]|uniref:Protein BZZ1 n=1 Tax=Mycoemilia scoparia TaxID=417184 RepID=A0A9W8AB55_9FUNG|nr:Protein BZZ1 [Mycoemilia scoparia]